MAIKRFNTFNESNKEKDNYMLLYRLQQDCEYFLGFGNGSENRLWAGNVKDQIAKMKELWENLSVKPEWLSYEEILNYEKEMLKKQPDERFTDVIIKDK
jgi:hypothetical protein